MPVFQIDSRLDAYFRDKLVAVAPNNIRPKIRRALAADPDIGGRASAEKFFGAELETIMPRVAALADWLDREFARRLNVKGLIIWLDATGFGNSVKMIQAFDEWAQMARPVKESIH